MLNNLSSNTTVKNPEVVELNIAQLLEFVCPFSAWHELDKPISKSEVLKSIENKTAELTETPLCLSVHACNDFEKARQNHINKIAYFVLNKPEKPIQLEISEVDEIYLNDGNHRLCGAIIRCDTTIKAELSGFIDSLILDDILQE